MRGVPVTGSPASHGWLGLLRSWLPARPHQGWSSPVVLADVASSAHAPGHGSVLVLAVDDNPVNLAVISAQLTSRGLVPMLAADGAEAVALACELQFDLILMDLQMPVLDGLGATSAIRLFETCHSRPAVPVLAYSSMVPGAGLLTAHGLNGSLAKPCGEHELEDCLVRWCPGYRPAGALRRPGSQPARSN